MIDWNLLCEEHCFAMLDCITKSTVSYVIRCFFCYFMLLYISAPLPPLPKGRGTALAVEGFFHYHVYVFAHTAKIPHYLIIGNSNHCKISAFYLFCANLILQQPFLFIVL